MYTLRVRTQFEAAHCIPGHPGACSRLHGHRYEVEAEFTGRELDGLGMVVDFGDLKRALADVVPDHTYLNEVLPGATTAEAIAEWLFGRLAERGLPVSAVTVWETADCACRYSPQ
ncbi:MAG: hypothetical protein AMXMBFR61_14860 [Fimbriimonadales bacterium]